MKSFRVLMASALSLLLCAAVSVSCKDDELALDKATVTMAAAGGTASVNLTANIGWKASSDQTWCTLVPTSGDGGTTVTISVTANTTTAERTANLSFTGGSLSATVIVKQVGAELTLKVDKPSVDATAEASNVVITVTANVAWTATSDQTWCTIAPTSGNGRKTITVTVKANTGYSARTATITIAAGEVTRTVTVNQAGDENAEPTPIIAINWGRPQRVATMGAYPRMMKLADGTLALVYENTQDRCFFRRSTNGGESWSEPVTTFRAFEATEGDASCTVTVCNAEIAQLHDGTLIAACNYRPTKDNIAPFAIALMRSSNMGATWSAAEVVYEAGKQWDNGCWEPSFLQLPSGELQLYFANEKPYPTTGEQQISMLRSHDYGRSWGEFTTVSFAANCRDGMPVARIVGNEIVVAIEDDHIGDFKPATVRCSLADNWKSPVLADSPQREYALSETIPPEVYMGAPYLAVMPTGDTFISYQTNQGHPNKNMIEVAVGDASARNFRLRSRPFDSNLTAKEWGCITVLDANTVAVAASSSDGIWIVKGTIVRE